MAQEFLSTGVATLDRHLGGGVPAGSLLMYTAPPTTQSELLLFECAAQRETLYVSTTRNDHLVEESLEAVNVDVGSVQVTYAPPDVALETASDAILDTGPETNVVVDTAGILEEYERHRYQQFLNRMLIHLRETGGMAMFHCHRSDDVPANRNLTAAMAELVLELHADRQNQTRETYFSIPKFRSGRALTDMVKVELTDRVTVDTSRNIA